MGSRLQSWADNTMQSWADKTMQSWADKTMQSWADKTMQSWRESLRVNWKQESRTPDASVGNNSIPSTTSVQYVLIKETDPPRAREDSELRMSTPTSPTEIHF